MNSTPALALLQVSPDALDPLRQIAWAETATAAGIIVLALLGIGFAVMFFSTLRALARLVAALEKATKQLTPRAEPIFDRVATLADDAVAISHSVRDEVEHVRETVDDVTEQVRAAAESTRERVRHFGVVLQVVQEEVEEILLDATATARGVHAAAGALRRATGPDGRTHGDASKEDGDA